MNMERHAVRLVTGAASRQGADHACPDTFDSPPSRDGAPVAGLTARRSIFIQFIRGYGIVATGR